MIYYRVDMQSLMAIERDLGMVKDKSKVALKSAINRTAAELRKRLMKGVREEYRLSGKNSKAMTAATKVKKATAARLSADLTVSSRIGELYDFQVSPKAYYRGGVGAPKWVKGRVKRAAALERLSSDPKHKAFVVRYRSGHLTVAERVPGKTMRNGVKEALKTLYSPSITKMEEMVYKAGLDGKIEDMLAEQCRASVERLLKAPASFAG